jgi:6-phosphofructokinase 1
LKKIGLVTSGGDAPGMNAAIRAIVRIGHAMRFEIIGFRRGWEGMITNTFTPLNLRSVGGILETGGTILHTTRCPRFKQKEGILEAAKTLALNNVDALMVIGGNGSLKGALELSKETDTVIIGIPASIDNDVFGTEETIGFDTAVNTAVTEIDKIRDTAISHERIFIIEVMGRDRGFIALAVGLTVGAETILVPEVKYTNMEIYQTLRRNSAKGKKSGIIVAAEGIGDTHKLAREIEENTKSEVRLSVLGYAQRGGNPTFRSRFIANLFAKKAIELAAEESGDRIVGLQNGIITSMELEKSSKIEKTLNLNLLKLANMLAI